MKRVLLGFAPLVLAAMAWTPSTYAQVQSGDRSDAGRIDELLRKIDIQNAKIDTLSRQILRLEQQISATRPGVMIGESPTPGATDAAKLPVQTGNSHVVAKGETLTSIAKMHKVTVEEIQKLNHIENDRKLQIGQTIMIPGSASAPSPTPTPPNG